MKILLFVFGIVSGGDTTLMPVVQQYDTAQACAEVAAKVDLTYYKAALVSCIDSSTGQLAYLRTKQ